MITQYHRPKSLEQALDIYQRNPEVVRFLTGGISRLRESQIPFEVIDLQDSGLKDIRRENHQFQVGGCTTLSEIKKAEVAKIYPDIVRIIDQDLPLNNQNSVTLSDYLFEADGRSPLSTALCALDAKVSLFPGDESVSLVEWFKNREADATCIIREVALSDEYVLQFSSVGRSPLDRPILCVAMGSYSNQWRIAVGGYGIQPVLVYQGDRLQDGILRAQEVCGTWQDEWASSEYRQAVVAVLINRFAK